MPLQWASKDMIIGNFTANALHLFVARERMGAEDVRGLRVSDLRRDDRQNFKAVVRRSSNVVRNRLQRLQTDAVHPTATQGTVAVYKMIHFYLMIFFSKKTSLATRFEQGGYVCHFLRLWRVSLLFWPNKKERNVDRCFYPNQTFRHVLMSTQSALMFILACTFLCPTTACGLEWIGSDCCEILFAMVGGWGVLSSWQRNFGWKQFLKKIADQNTLLFMAALGNVWFQTHRSDKCEFDAKLHEDADAPDADLTDYPTPEIAVARWNKGMEQAESDLIQLGVKHLNIPAHAWERPWLFDPPNPNPDVYPFDEYLSRKYDNEDSDGGNDDSDGGSDDSDGGSDDSDGGSDDSNGGSDNPNDDSSESSDDSSDDFDEHLQLNNAVARLHDSVNEDDEDAPRHMIQTPSGKKISKATAVIMLKELYLAGSKELSKDRLRRIEQCAASSQIINQQLVEHDGSHLELFQDVCMAFDDGPDTNLRPEFGRIQKLVVNSKRTYLRLSAVPLDDVPAGLELRCRFYKRVGESLTFKYSGKPDLNRYSAKSVIMIVHFKYDQRNDNYILSDSQWEDINSELRKLRADMISSNKSSKRTSQKRKQRHIQEARDIQKDATSRYRSDSTTMRRSRRQRSKKRMGTVTHTDENDTQFRVGMRVRLFHEVSTHTLIYTHVHSRAITHTHHTITHTRRAHTTMHATH